MRERIIEKATPAIDESDVVVIHNWADPEFITPRPKAENWFAKNHDLLEEFTLLYSGNIGQNHDLDTILEAADAIELDNVGFLIIGEGDHKQSLVQKADRMGLRDGRITFLPYQLREELPYSLTSGDVSIVTVQEGLEGLCVSSKLYSALAAGMPVLVIAHPSADEACIVRRFDAGFSVKQGDVERVIEIIGRWTSNPELVSKQGQNAREVFEERFTKHDAIDRDHALLAEDQSAVLAEFHRRVQ
jgi:glycosyltransferase involved in cell wall biosynthesis